MQNKKHYVQLTIDFLVKSEKDKIDSYFILDWNNRNDPDEYPFFSKTKPDTYTIIYGLNIKLIHLPIFITGFIAKRKDELLHNLSIPSDDIPIYTNIHFLKSHLQKNIRQKQFSLAIKTSKHLLDIDPIQFLRRISIIIIEDAFLTKHYSTVIWLLIAVSNNCLELQLHHIEWLLGFVHITCQSKWKESYVIPKELEQLSDEKLSKYILERLKFVEDKYQSANVISLLIRASFGGMNSDMRMLIRAAYVWTERFIKNEGEWKEYYYSPMRTISGSVIPLYKNEWNLAAIDYHCFPKMLKWLQDGDIEMDDEQIKYLIWNFSSRRMIENIMKKQLFQKMKDMKNGKV